MARPGRPAMPKPDLHPMVDSFLDMLTTERGAAMNTRHAYWRDLADVSLLRLFAIVAMENTNAYRRNIEKINRVGFQGH